MDNKIMLVDALRCRASYPDGGTQDCDSCGYQFIVGTIKGCDIRRICGDAADAITACAASAYADECDGEDNDERTGDRDTGG